MGPCADRVIHIVGLTRPKIVFCEKSTLRMVEGALVNHGLEAASRIIVVDQRVEGVGFLYDLIEAHDDEDLFHPTELDNSIKHPAILMCTSGSTGLPKCVAIPHAMILEKIAPPSREHGVSIFYNYHTIGGYIALIYGTLAGHTRIITTQTVDAQRLFSIIERYGVTLILATPIQVAYLLQCPSIKSTDLSKITLLICTGNQLLDEHKEQIQAYFPDRILHSYASTECCGCVASILSSRTDGTVGTLTTGVSVRIVSEQNERCGPGIDGELYIRTPLPCLGYYGEDDKTAATWDADGWYRSGDIGHFDDDGFLYMADRKKDLVHHNGFLVASSKLENTILGCPGVAQACVVDIPDTRSTNLLAAVFVQTADQTPNNITKLVNDAFDGAVDFGDRVYAVEQIPAFRNGKVNRDEVKRIALERFLRSG